MNFIKKIFDGEIDEKVHVQFRKFSKGEFKDRGLVEIKKSKDGATIKTSFEFANDLVATIAQKIQGKTHITGAIICTSDLRNELGIEIKDMKQFMGVKNMQIDCEMSKEQILEICERFPAAFVLLSFSVNGTTLKIKPKSPKSAKPSTSDKEAKADFCSVKTNDMNIVKEFAFDVDAFKHLKIKHAFKIGGIIIPTGEKDPEKIRLLAKKRGKIIRELDIDGKKIIKEVVLEA